MKLRDLIERLMDLDVELREGLGDDVEPEVIAAIQPSYPLTATIDGVVVLDDDHEPLLMNGCPIVWIATGSHPHGISPYAPRAVHEQAS